MFNQATSDFLLGRGLEPEIASRYGLNTANVAGINNGASVLSFAYFRNEITQYEKYRLLPKERFWQQKGRKPLFWNADALDDPLLENGQMPLVICEGELDALTAIQCGFPLSVSVPDGAPPASPRGTSDSGSDDQTGKFEFIARERDRIRKIRRFVLAVDFDAPGERLREELIRRLSPARCSFVEYPSGCKDLNDILIKVGAEAVVAAINGAKPCPVKGLYRLSDYPTAELQTFSTGWPLVDWNLKLFAGEFMVVTGIPQHGKSSWALNLLANAAKLHGFRSAVFSPEMPVMPIIRNRLRELCSLAFQPDQDAWIEDNFVFIGSDPVGADDDDFDLEWIIERAIDAVFRVGIRILLIDPWNEVEHARAHGESMPDYVARGIRALKRFARTYNVIVIVVAHPTKMQKSSGGTYDVPSLYDIADSAAWYNKADHGVVINRKWEPAVTEVRVVKSRFAEAGASGMVTMRFDGHRFSPLQMT